MSRSLARIVLALALAAAAVAGSACDKKSSAKPIEVRPNGTAPAEAKPAAGKPAEPDFTITARDLYAEFRPQIEAGTADAVRAKYTGKTVRISGDVKTNADLMGTWELTLVANDQTGQAYLHPSPAGAADVKALKPGDKATFQCISEGWEIGPQLKDCVVVK